MNTTTTTCPAWCVTDHTAADITNGGYHHDGADVSLLFAPGSFNDHLADSWTVKPSQHVSDDEHMTVSAPRVEIQDDRYTIAALTPCDALELARLLEQAAAVADPVAVAEEIDRRAAASIGTTVSDARQQWPAAFPLRLS